MAVGEAVMKSIAVTGCVVAVLTALTQATATQAETTRKADKASDYDRALPHAVSKYVKFRCSMPASNHFGRVLVTTDTLNGKVLVELANWRSEAPEIHIHRNLLRPIFRQSDVPLANDSKAHGPYIRVGGSIISAENDGIVANFTNNALARNERQPSVRQGPGPKFSGLKAFVGRKIEREEDGREIEVNVYFRIIVDWGYQSQNQEVLSLHRAAVVITQKPVGVGGGQEKFYRFLPNLSPFQMLVCVLGDGRGI